MSDTNNRRLREIDADGVIRTLAGRGPSPRPQHAIATALAMDGAGDAYLGDFYQAVLWKVARDGTTSVVEGVYTYRVDDDGHILALRAFWQFDDMTFEAPS